MQIERETYKATYSTESPAHAAGIATAAMDNDDKCDMGDYFTPGGP